MQIPAELEGKATTDVATLGKILHIGRNQAYAAVRDGEIKSFRIGGKIVIPVAPLLRMLEIDEAA